MSAAAEAAWRDQVEKLIRWQNKVNKGDHAWRLNEEDPGERNPFHVEEDETRVKPRVRWEQRRDTLIGFCGEKVEHVFSRVVLCAKVLFFFPSIAAVAEVWEPSNIR
ncbi:hypothetical protein R1sor_024125 [Riccia sorocarpa]|uniref:Uncharacterized protein n=1 Tax=Riccia sorocarpa TaxID=122646 RepID=A0ABD3GVL3_9MARC